MTLPKGTRYRTGSQSCPRQEDLLDDDYNCYVKSK